MNRALLADLQRQQVYPSITLLMNTTPGVLLSQSEIATARHLAEHVARRLDGDVCADLRATLGARLNDLIDQQITERSAHALALCVSPDYTAAVRLGRTVRERVIIDDTFATRDLVADLNRTALYRVLTISERKTRVLIGDHARLVEERTDRWPMIRAGESATSWSRDVAQSLADEHNLNPLPTILAGVDRTLRKPVIPVLFHAIGIIPGNQDRTSWTDLHNAAWPLVSNWLRTEGTRAIGALDRARSTCRFAGGIDAIWPLANEGRVETLVVEDGYAIAARISNGQIQQADDNEAPDVIDDIIDDTIETVLRYNGAAVIVADGELRARGRIAAILRY